MFRELAILLLLAGVAQAQPTEDAQKAREAFAEGTSAFNLGQWQQAVEAWERGYKLKSDAVFLYNIGQAYRLANQPDKALFFYRNYLRNSADAPNREEVAQRIAQLEKIVAAQDKARDTPPAAPLPPPSPSPSAAPVAATAPHERCGDLGVGLGLRLWAAGVTASPSLVLSIAGGYALYRRGRIELRLGAEIDYSYLTDIHSTDHFISILAAPVVRARLWRERIYLSGELGLGAQLVAGLSSGSALLLASSPARTEALFLLRPALALEFRPISRLWLWLSPALGYSPLPSRFAARSLLEVDLMVGASLRL